MIVVAISQPELCPAETGRKPSCSKACRLSSRDTPASAPATIAPYTDLGRRFLARALATATDSNHSFPTAAILELRTNRDTFVGLTCPTVTTSARSLGNAVTTDVPPRGAVVLVPLGSTEQHGPHLPLDTDTKIAVAVAEAACAGRADLWVAPALSYGSSGEHAGFRGTLSIGTEVLRAALIELVRSAADSFAAVIFVNGHGGNLDALREAVAQMQTEGHTVAHWWPRVPDGDAHAGRTETSLMLAIDPESVRVDAAAPGATEPLATLLPTMRQHGVAGVSPNGVLGDPSGASGREGEALLQQFVEDLVLLVDQYIDQ